ncbi:cell division protein ZapE [Antarctobacter heliothermus]|uniref:Cell division protein ZapE n=1 Tax=Antarctobacter heliothermus TaxID=74033 RepID=A0A222E189_9RHOB|nr:cell division protein ZapE [Antarctobacter heliothermus]ASP19956.1 cell division protein ZapE [Antarctobacter heliothermus]
MPSVIDLYNSRVASGKIKPDEAQTAVLPEFERLRADLAQPVKRGFFRRSVEAPKGLYLWGGVGRGKSMLMDLFVETLDVPARRVHFHAFMQEVQGRIHTLRGEGAEDPIKPVAKEISDSVRLLAFDEMQITDIADAMIVGRLFEALFEGGTTVVTTSNRVPNDLYKDGLNRQLFLPFIDLLKERMVVRELASERDHRQDRLAGTQVYFSPANAAARTQIDTLWEELTHGQEEPLTLHVKGREVELPRYHNGVARADFFDLCGRMLGPADYLKLAESVRVLILENIPQLSRRNFNEARRFVTLIDTLYEARVKLIASAAAQPEMLYVEGEGSFEFERTASRLREMQAADWAVEAG